MKKRFIEALFVFGVLAILIYLSLVNFTEPTEIGIARNAITGEMWVQEGGGIHFTAPWVRVACVSTHPIRVSVTTTGRGYSAKLVKFEASEWRSFVEVEGFRYYWWGNRLSFNLGYHEEYRGIRDIFRGYAYSAKKYPFLLILDEYQHE